MAVALFFFSCEDENSTLGFRNPVPKFNVSYIEIPLTSNVQLIDSIITDSKSLTDNFLVGRYKDEVFGEVTAQPYLQIYPRGASVIDNSAVLDSVTVSLRLNFYGYGFDGEVTHKFAVHELGDSLDRINATRYYSNSPGLSMKGLAMDTANIKLKASTLNQEFALNANQQDTVVVSARLSNELGQRLLDLAKAYDFQSTSVSAQVREFVDKVRGITLVPLDRTGIIGFKVNTTFSAVTLHYRTYENTAVKDTLTRSFAFNTASFTKISAERSGTVFANALPYQSQGEFSTSGTRYLQSGHPVISKLDLQNFYTFADTVGNVLVNEASIVINGVESPINTPPISRLGLKLMNENNQFTNYGLATTDRTAIAPYLLTAANPNGSVLLDFRHYLVKSDVSASGDPELASLRYSEGQYSERITFFLQQLLKYRNDADGINETRVRYLGLYPLSPSVAGSVSRTVFPASGVKLRIYYTKPTITINP